MEILKLKVKDLLVVDNSRNDTGDLAPLMTSIKSNGLMNPLTVTKSLSGKFKGKYVVVAGHRRLASIKKLGHETVDCNVLDVKSEVDAIVLNLTENIQRKDTNPFEEGRYFLELQKKYNLSVAETSVRVGVSKNYIDSAVLVYKQLPKKYRSLVKYDGKAGPSGKGGIPLSTAKKIIEHCSRNEARAEIKNDMLEMAKAGTLKQDDLNMFSQLAKYTDKLNFDEYLANRDKFEILRVDVPVLKSEAAKYLVKMSKKELAHLIIYGEVKPLSSPAKVLGTAKPKKKSKEV